MKVLICGIDGYIGHTLALHLKSKGHEILGIDDYSRRAVVKLESSDSLTPIATRYARRNILGCEVVDLELGSDPDYTLDILQSFKPNAIYHLAEQPSAPFSMKDFISASHTQRRNVMSTLDLLWAMKGSKSDIHLIKIGTMGEYGTPNCNIPEGKIPAECLHPDYMLMDVSNTYDPAYADDQCPMQTLLFPRTPGSFYHASKVMDTTNIEMACRLWELRSTDIMQGVVFGLNETKDDFAYTRFDYDECFGTVINRFCVQAIAQLPLTIYGKGGQTRGFLPLKDSIQCLTIALENPPEVGEYRTFNQFENIYSINQLADMVQKGAQELGITTISDHVPNPRIEAEEHYYNPTHQKLFDLGYKPTTDIQGEITKLIKQLLPFRGRIQPGVIMPRTKWR